MYTHRELLPRIRICRQIAETQNPCCGKRVVEGKAGRRIDQALGIRQYEKRATRRLLRRVQRTRHIFIFYPEYGNFRAIPAPVKTTLHKSIHSVSSQARCPYLCSPQCSFAAEDASDNKKKKTLRSQGSVRVKIWSASTYIYAASPLRTTWSSEPTTPRRDGEA